MPEASISIYHDTRRAKKDSNPQNKKVTEVDSEEKNKLYPVKLRVYFNKETRHYPIGIDLTRSDFDRSYLAEKPRNEYRDLKFKISSHEVRANEIRKDLRDFSFDKFERLFLRRSGAGTDVFYYLDQMIATLRKNEQEGNARVYETAAINLTKYLKETGKRSRSLPFLSVTQDFLNAYERWLLDNGRNYTTVGYNMRPIATAFNTAIEKGEIDRDLYPFGKKKYKIPTGRSVKRALTKEDLKKLLTYELQPDSHMAKARGLWFFSYLCNGMNIRDMAELKYKNIDGDIVSFIRKKTRNTTKDAPILIRAVLAPLAKEVINLYGTPQAGPESFVFPIFKAGMKEADRVKVIKAITNYVNYHINNLAKLAGVDYKISTYWARHTFTSIAVNSGASLEFIQDSLGHGSITTTMNYWKGFDDSVKKDVASKLLDL